MLIFYHNTTWHHSPEDLYLNLHCCENLKSRMVDCGLLQNARNAEAVAIDELW
jgi:hypothetical protein